MTSINPWQRVLLGGSALACFAYAGNRLINDESSFAAPVVGVGFLVLALSKPVDGDAWLPPLQKWAASFVRWLGLKRWYVAATTAVLAAALLAWSYQVQIERENAAREAAIYAQQARKAEDRRSAARERAYQDCLKKADQTSGKKLSPADADLWRYYASLQCERERDNADDPVAAAIAEIRADRAKRAIDQE